jgi:hypothetical protein
MRYLLATLALLQVMVALSTAQVPTVVVAEEAFSTD